MKSLEKNKSWMGVSLLWLGIVTGSSVLLAQPESRSAKGGGDDAPPTVQMLLPGFSVRQLPIELTNVNNLRYRNDGQLYALGYNGDVWLLRDSDGDQLEDSAKKFFDSAGRLRGPIGMAVIPDGHALLKSIGDPIASSTPRGVVVASKGKVSALLDLDGNDVAEEERVIASGWVEIPQNVDAIGVAISPIDGGIYFGIGVKDYNKAYQLDEKGVSQFSLNTERGTIQRIAPDLTARETICTGVRFTIGLAFNEHHELFATDQEGATWLANGNPFDELLHIQSGKHYGFPPRHPKYLPTVFDEPSLFDYRPQHQSTCGLAFNLPCVENGPIFGPSSWRGDAIVCGESRGKLYRTKLVRDEASRYVATNQLIGCLSMLTVDCCLSPRGDLMVACHSGGPDWGSGPSGSGTIFQIRYQEPRSPQPIAIWSASPNEVRVEFDKPIDIESVKNLAKQTTIEFGEFVAAADRLETIRPGYAVTKFQQGTSRSQLSILSAGITPDRKTLHFQTLPHRQAMTYAITLPGLGRESARSDSNSLPQKPELDLAYSLQGVQVDWRSAAASESQWSGWIPYLDLQTAKAFATEMQHTMPLWENLKNPGTITFQMRIDPRGLFYPAIQPGSVLDYPNEDDQFVVGRRFILTSDSSFLSGESATTLRTAEHNDGRYTSQIDLPAHPSELVPLVVQMKTGGDWPRLQIAWSAQLASNEVRSGPLAPTRLLLPWAETSAVEPTTSERPEIIELADANWGRGRRIFFDEKVGCSKCHTTQSQGGTNGPDLSNLIHRDYSSVLRDILQPSYSINPDFIAYHTLLKDSRVLIGSIKSELDKIHLSDREGKVTTFFPSDVEEMKPSTVSVMPEGLLEKLDAVQRRDLMAFLLTPPPSMPNAQLYPQKLRRRSEVQIAMANSLLESGSSDTTVKSPVRPLHLLLVAGKKDHGPGEHDYPAWLNMWSQLMSAGEAVTVSATMEWPTDEQWGNADSVIFFQKGKWSDERKLAIDRHLANRRGLVYIHWGIEGGQEADAMAERIGLSSFARDTKYRHGPLELLFDSQSKHPIIRNFERMQLYDESYWNLHGDARHIRTLSTAIEAGGVHPQFWVKETGGGRVFVSIPGHYSSSFHDPLFRLLLLRGIAWSSNESVDRFNELVSLGVQFENE